MHLTDLSHPSIQRVIEVASRKGVALDIRLMSDTPRTAEETARVVDAELGQIVKSILFVVPRAEGRLVPIVCLVSGCNDVDLPRLAAVTGEVAIRQATAREVRDLTGFSTGGIPPFGHARGVRILMDQDLAQYQWIWAAAGTDTAVFRVAPRTLQMLSNAIVAPVATSTWMPAAAAPNLAYGVGSGA